MATILCKYSGITFKCDHFPVFNSQSESHHPIFDVPLKKLWRYFSKWQAGELTKTDSYLLFIAYLRATEMVEFRCHIWQRPDTDRIIASNMEHLFHTIGNVITIKHPKFSLPRFVISPETRDLSNIKYWIETWDNCFEDFCNGLKDADMRSRLQRKEAALQRLIRNPNLKPVRYAHMLASWAAEATPFPEHCSDYWQEIIVNAHTDTNMMSVPQEDLAELLEYCEVNLDAGSIQAHQLFATLRDGMETLQGFFSPGNTTFAIMKDSDSVEQLNLKLLIDSAPMEIPKRTEYGSDFQFLKAKMKYQLAMNAIQKQTGDIQ
jgi:hypothetical protein